MIAIRELSSRAAQRVSLAAGAAIVSATIVFALPADAKIRCSDGYQAVSGSHVSTPYCQDEYVAQVAREYGVRTSGAQIRGNPQHKLDVCRLVGRDNRVSQACIDAFPSGRGPRS